MEGKAPANRTVAVARIAWLATFVLPLVLTGMLLAVKAADAVPPGGTVIPFALDEELETGYEGEPEEGACAYADVTADEGDLEELEVEEGELEAGEAEDACADANDDGDGRARPGSVAPEECLVRSAHARVVVYASLERLRATVGYTTYEPTAATLDVRLEGGKGSLHVGSARRRLGRSGVLRLSRSLSASQMSKVEAAGHFTVRLHGAEAPGSCRPFEIEELDVEHSSKRLAIWSPKA